MSLRSMSLCSVSLRSTLLRFAGSCVALLGVTSTVSAQAGKPAQSTFTVTSTDVRPGGSFTMRQVYGGFGCTGQNVSPALKWSGAPAGTQSYAVTIYDPDAPTGSGWWHWVVYNIPASATSLATGAGDPKRDAAHGGLPAGSVQGTTDFGTKGFGGPCPPAGDKPHRYLITVHALSVPSLDIPASATAAFVGFNVHGHELGAAKMTVYYGR